MEDIERIEVISGPGATIWGSNAVNGVINIITRAVGDTQGLLAEAGGGSQQKTGSLRIGGKLDNGISGANLLGRFSMALAQDSELRLQAYFDHTERSQPLAFAERLDTLDLEAQHALRLNARHRIVWGAGYRYSWDQAQPQPGAGFAPLLATLNLHWGNVFAQDEIALREDLLLTFGMKFEHNNYTGFESLPTLRLAWKPNGRQLVWSALSRTVRSPSRIDRDFFSPLNPSIVGGVPKYTLAGGQNFMSESARVLEIGYRAQPSTALSLSATAFYGKYDDLRTLEPQAGGGAVFRNLGEGMVRGIETWGTWNIRRNWRLSGGLVVQRIDTSLQPGSLDASGGTGLATNDPSLYWSVRSSHDLNETLQFAFSLRHVGALPKPQVPSYYEMDMRLGWKPQRNLELALIGQNLLHNSHPEFGSDPARSLIERNVMLQAVLRY